MHHLCRMRKAGCCFLYLRQTIREPYAQDVRVSRATSRVIGSARHSETGCAVRRVWKMTHYEPKVDISNAAL